jgi:hypothetical protein
MKTESSTTYFIHNNEGFELIIYHKLAVIYVMV